MKNTMTNGQTSCCQDIRTNIDQMIDSMAPGYRMVGTGNNCLGELAAPPVLEVTEDMDNYYVIAHVPNTANPDLKVEVTKSELIISGNLDIEITRTQDTTDTNTRYTRANISFERALSIPQCIVREAVTACMNDGSLEITLPKTSAQRSNMINICCN